MRGSWLRNNSQLSVNKLLEVVAREAKIEEERKPVFLYDLNGVDFLGVQNHELNL